MPEMDDEGEGFTYDVPIVPFAGRAEAVAAFLALRRRILPRVPIPGIEGDAAGAR